MKKIVVTGPESSGKSTLAKQLASHFNSDWVAEYARDYLNNLQRPYNELDLIEIAKGQINLEKEKEANSADLLFYDTDLLTIQIWSDHKYGRCDLWILEQYANRTKDLYLLCKPDLPWEPDPLRESPNQLNELFNIYKENLKALKVDFEIVDGVGEQRLKNAINLIHL